MKIGKALTWIFGSATATGLAIGGALAFGQFNQKKLFECHTPDAPMSAMVVQWRITGGYGLGILNADNRIAYAENGDSPGTLKQKAEQFCRTRQLTMQ